VRELLKLRPLAYAVSTGTLTSVDFATLVAIGASFRRLACRRARHAVRSDGLPAARSEGRKRGQPPATSGPRSRCRRRQPGQL